MKRSCIAIALLIASISASSAAPKSFSLETAFTATAPLNPRTRDQIHLRVLPDTASLEVRFRATRQLLPLKTWDETQRGEVIATDFNFDGNTDIAVPSGIGYGGVNYFYTLYTFQPAKGRFTRLDFPGDGGPDLCNPELNAATRTIQTDCKSGPRWYAADFRFRGPKPYIALSAEMFLLPGFPVDQLVYLTTEWNANGTKRGVWLRDAPRDLRPALRYLPLERAYLYTAPDDQHRTNNYIIRNDPIRLLEVKGSDFDSLVWLRVGYQSRRLGHLLRWIKLEP